MCIVSYVSVGTEYLFCVMAGYKGYDINYKVLLVGDSGVGKTALIKSLMGKTFSTSHRATVGECMFYNHCFKILIS